MYPDLSTRVWLYCLAAEVSTFQVDVRKGNKIAMPLPEGLALPSHARSPYMYASDMAVIYLQLP